MPPGALVMVVHEGMHPAVGYAIVVIVYFIDPHPGPALDMTAQHQPYIRVRQHELLVYFRANGHVPSVRPNIPVKQ